MDEFLKDVEPDDVDAIIKIKDELKLCLKVDRNSPIGDFKIIKNNSNDAISVKVCSNAKIGGLLSSSEIIGLISKSNFSVVEQAHDEGIEQVAGEFVTKSTKIQKIGDKVLIEQGPRVIVKSEFESNENILAESGSFVFEALLARVGFHKEIALPWFDRSNCKQISKVLYRPLADKQVIALDGTDTVAYGVEKIITRLDENGNQVEKFTWFSYYSKTGALLEREQQDDMLSSNSSQTTTSNDPLLSPALPFYAIVETIPEELSMFQNDNKSLDQAGQQRIDINTDVQMQSELHRLTCLHKSEHTTYLKQNPLVLEIISDLTQHLLIHKPVDPMKEIYNFFDT